MKGFDERLMDSYFRTYRRAPTPEEWEEFNRRTQAANQEFERKYKLKLSRLALPNLIVELVTQTQENTMGVWPGSMQQQFAEEEIERRLGSTQPRFSSRFRRAR